MTDYYDGEMEAIDIIKEVTDGVDGEASIKKHPNEWRLIVNYDWSKE